MGSVSGKQEYSSRTLGATWGIISAIMVPIVIILICIGWRILVRRKQEEKDENDFLTIKSRTIDPDESMKINSDDESIPYKKDTEEDSPEPTDPVRVVDNADYTDAVRVADQPFTYGMPAPPPPPVGADQRRQWGGETEIN